MIDVADNNKAYYYHFNGLGSGVALSNSNGDSCQSYEYSAYGQVAASDPNHPNPYMFTGRRFDIETELYYYRARYYNPHIGRFMQTDPVGYSASMNLYAYCVNNPLVFVDPSGLIRYYDPCDVLAGIIYDSTTDNWWGLVGSWTFDDVRSAYITAPGELLSREVDGITVYVEIDLELLAPDLDLSVREGRGEIVRLQASDFKDIRFRVEQDISNPTRATDSIFNFNPVDPPSTTREKGVVEKIIDFIDGYIPCKPKETTEGSIDSAVGGYNADQRNRHGNAVQNEWGEDVTAVQHQGLRSNPKRCKHGIYLDDCPVCH